MSAGLSRRLVLGAALPAVLPAIARAEEPFDLWLEGLRRDARAAGVRASTLDRALAGIAPIPRVIELDRKQPEGRFTFDEYRARVVTEQRIVRGRELAADPCPAPVARAGTLRRAGPGDRGPLGHRVQFRPRTRHLSR